MLDPLIRRILKGARLATTERRLQEARARPMEGILIPFPRIKKDGRSYVCRSLGHVGWGPTPKRAYEAWARSVMGAHNAYSIQPVSLQKNMERGLVNPRAES